MFTNEQIRKAALQAHAEKRLTEPVPSVEYCINRRRKLLSGQEG